MEIRGLSRRDRERMAEALRRGEPIDLRLDAPPPPDVRLDEIGPLCRSISSRDPRLRAELAAWLPPPPAADPPPGVAVTAVIPANRGPPLGLAALLAQDVPVHVLVISNGEAGPASAPGAEVLRLPWQGHGATRQAALAHVATPYVLFTVDDAVPLGAGMVRTLVEALEEGRWEAVFARQIPWPDADRITRERLRRWTPAGLRVVPAPQVDHVAALYRAETLRRHPLPPAPIAEDAWWSRGRRIGYVPTAAVLHAHERAPGELYRRNRDIHAELAKMGCDPTVPSLAALAAALPGAVRPAILGGRGEWLNQVAELAGQWRGGRRGRR